MQWMFGHSFYFNQDISRWDVSSVTNMSYMFCENQDFMQDLSEWDVSNVTDMNGMFQGAMDFNSDIGSWDVSTVTKMAWMFNSASMFNQDLSNWCVEKIPTKPENFSNGSSLQQENHPHWGEDCITGLDETKMSKLIIFPNPAKSNVWIDISSGTIKEINIYNQFNQRIICINTCKGKLDVSGLKTGLYIIELMTEEGIYRNKLVKN